MFDIFCMQITGNNVDLPAHTQYTRWNGTHLDTIRRCVNRARTEYVWIKEILRLSKLPLSSYDKIQLESRFIQNRNVFLKNIQKCLNTVEWIEKDIKYKISNREQYLGF